VHKHRLSSHRREQRQNKVGFRDYARAITEQGKAALAEYAETDSEGARRLQTALATASELKDQALAKTDTHLAAFAQTSRGQKTVRLVERAQKEIGQLPGVTAIADASRSVHGVGALAELVVEQPTNPWAYVWLAEALRKMKQTQRITTGIRAVVEPSSLLTKSAITGLNKVGSAGASLEDLLLRRAYILACQALTAQVSGDSLHVLARVYRAAGQPDGAATALRPALLLAGKHAGAAHATSARLHYEQRDFRAARQDAQAALKLGCSIGNEVLADLVSAQARGGPKVRAEAVQHAAELRGTVRRADLVSYYGTYSTTGEALTKAKDAQKAKATATATRVRNVTGDLPKPRSEGDI
jgi:hypothetical protein